MESELEQKVFVTLKMTEDEAVWLRTRMQNYIEPMRPATEPPILEEPEDAQMRSRFFHALKHVVG